MMIVDDDPGRPSTLTLASEIDHDHVRVDDDRACFAFCLPFLRDVGPFSPLSSLLSPWPPWPFASPSIYVG